VGNPIRIYDLNYHKCFNSPNFDESLIIQVFICSPKNCYYEAKPHYHSIFIG